MAKKSRRKVNPPNSGGGHLPRQEQPPSIQRQEELELGQLLSNLSTETTAPCWICLEEGVDNDGKLPVRDCSCRGDAAGFAHLSCLIEYAKSKSKNLIGTVWMIKWGKTRKTNNDNRVDDEADGAWHICPNCDQQYQNQHRIDLARAFVAFVESVCSHNYGMMVALRVNTDAIIDVLMERTRCQRIPLSRSGGDDDALSAVNLALRDEAIILLKRYLAIVSEEVKRNKSRFAKFMHMTPTSKEYKMYGVAMESDAYANERLGLMYTMECNKEDFLTAVNYFKRAQVILKMLHGGQDHHAVVTANLERTRNKLARLDGNTTVTPTGGLSLESKRKSYAANIRHYGENHDVTIFSGIELAEELRQQKHGIEAQRLATKLSTSCRQVLGSSHAYTKRIDEIRRACTERLVFVYHDLTKPDSKQQFNALRYDNDGDVYVVMGPIKEPRNIITEREFRFPRDNVLFKLGLPVSCYGLKNSSHLNGEIGDVNHFYNAKTKHPIEASLILLTFLLERQWFRVIVHFANKSLPPAAVKLENLRIVFELPQDAPTPTRTGKQDKI